MRASEILRNLADLIDAVKTDNTTYATPTLSPVSVDNTDNTEKSGVFVPPLQAKIELLKKSVNVDSIYDQAGAEEKLTGYGKDNEDDLAHIKKLAGINVIAMDEAGSDEPMDV